MLSVVKCLWAVQFFLSATVLFAPMTASLNAAVVLISTIVMPVLVSTSALPGLINEDWRSSKLLALWCLTVL